MTTTVQTDDVEAIRLPSIELERSRARAQSALFGDDATVRVGRYELGDRLGAGGMGLVYRAFDPSLRRSVALKVLRTESAAQLSDEASVQASLDDPDVLRVFDIGTHGDVQFMAMELAQGTTVTEWLESDDRAKQEIVAVFLEAGRILARVHEAGVVHRDFKPGNVVVRAGEGAPRVRLLDFGLAVATGASRVPVAGTPGYMAPEVLAGGRLSPRADQYAFCVSVSDALGGMPLSRRLQRVLRRGTSVRASRRFESMTPIVEALAGELARPRRRLAVSVVLACGFVVLGTVGGLASERTPGLGLATQPTRGRAEQLEAALADAKTAIAMGRDTDAAALEAEAREALDHDDWTTSVAYWVLGELDHARGDFEQARTHYEDAAFLGLRVGNDRVVVRASAAMVELGDVWGLGASSSEAWMRQARAALARSPTEELEIHVAIASGWRELSAGRHEAALASFDRALGVAEQWAGDDSTLVSALHYDLGCALVARRQYASAGVHFESALAGWTRTFGRDASVLALAWKGQGDVARGQGRFDAAVEAYEQGRAVIDHDAGAGSLKAATLEVSLADALYRLGRNRDALAAYQRARALLLPLNENHRFLAVVEIGMGNLERDRKRWSDAFAHYRRARDLSHEVEGPQSLNAAIAASSAAEAAMNLERYEEALALLDASIDTRVALFGDDDLSLAFPLTTLGELQRRSGRPKLGLTALHRALGLRQQAKDVDSRLLAETHLALTRTYEDLGSTALAIEHAKAARAGFDGPWAHAAEDVAMVDAVLARLGTAG